MLHRDLALDLYRGEVLALVGASGSGKSVLLRTLARASGTRRPARSRSSARTSRISIGDAMRPLERRWGVLFQDGALFSSLTVAENIEVPLKETLGVERAAAP